MNFEDDEKLDKVNDAPAEVEPEPIEPEDDDEEDGEVY